MGSTVAGACVGTVVEVVVGFEMDAVVELEDPEVVSLVVDFPGVGVDDALHALNAIMTTTINAVRVRSIPYPFQCGPQSRKSATYKTAD